MVDAAAIARADIVPANAARLLATYLQRRERRTRPWAWLHWTRARLGASPAVVVLADHGESLFDEPSRAAHAEPRARLPPYRVSGPCWTARALGELAPARRRLARPDDGGWRAAGRLGSPGRLVFQYLGDLSRPRAIADTSVS